MAAQRTLPTVSINLCCYNGETFLEETLESIRSQTYKDWELVVVNDGSRDSTEEIVMRYVAKGLPIIYQYQKNAGVASARNKALELSHGEYIAFIDQDDIWLPEKLEKQVPLFDDKKVGLVFTDAIYFNCEGGQARLYRNRTLATGYIFRELLVHYFLCLSTVMVSRRAIEEMSHRFDERFQMAEEADVFCRIAYSWQCRYVPEPLVKYRVHSASTSWTKMELAPKETELMMHKFSRLFPDFEHSFSAELSLLREIVQYQYAKIDLMKGNARVARRRLVPIVFRDLRFMALYLLTFCHKNIFNMLLSVTKVMPTVGRHD